MKKYLHPNCSKETTPIISVNIKTDIVEPFCPTIEDLELSQKGVVSCKIMSKDKTIETYGL